MYPIVEHFYTLQGEGFHSGKPSYFIRLGGCDVGCTWCDTKYSWPLEGHKMLPVDDILKFVTDSGTKHVVITGGEPTMHDLHNLTGELSKANITTQIETSGAHDLIGKVDWITLSPKKFMAPKQAIYMMANELKVVVFNKSDLKWAQDEAEKCRPEIPKYLQPEWSSPSMIPLVTDFCKTNPEWSISLQMHKLIDIP